MVKKASALAIAGIAFFSWASNTSVAKVDATTQATIHNNIKFVLPFKVASDSAIVKWKDVRSRSTTGTVSLSFGSTEATMTKKTVTATKNAADTTYSANLSGLTSNTTYKIRIEVSDPATTNPHKSCADTTTIATKSTTFAMKQFSAKKEIAIELLDHSVKFGTFTQHGDHITIVDTKGQTLLSHFVAGSETAVSLPSSAMGVVLLTCSRSGNVIASKKVTIVR
jgi:hypothetical protein